MEINSNLVTTKTQFSDFRSVKQEQHGRHNECQGTSCEYGCGLQHRIALRDEAMLFAM